MKKQMHKLLAYVLSIIMVVGIFSGTAFAAGETTIDTIEINDVVAPLPGGSVSVGPTGTLPAGVNYEIQEVNWYNQHYAIIGSAEFEHSQAYAASFKLVPKSGYIFEDEGSISVTINGNTPDFISIGPGGSYAIVRILLYAYPVMTIEDIIINGSVDSAITTTEVIVKVAGGTFNTQDKISSSDRLKIANLPEGLTQTVQRVNDTTAKIVIEGTPTVQSSDDIVLSFLNSVLTPSPNSIILNNNSNAKFNITGVVTTPLTGTVAINGVAKYGETLTAVVSGSNNTGTLQYMWMRNGSAITGANSETYVLTSSDVGKEITVKVTSTVETGSLTSTGVNVDKADAPAAPTGLSGVAPTVDGGNDGKITGVTTMMKWSKNSDFSESIWCTGTEITNLTGGTYYVRIAETGTHKASDIVSVIVPGGKYKVSVTDGSTDKTEYAPGETVTITAYPAVSGKQFAKWVTEDGVTFVDATKTTTTFVMPEKNVTVKAIYEDKAVTYKVTVVGGNADKTEYAPGETVTITAYDAASGKQFAKWITEDGVTFVDATKTTTTFVMPAKDVRVDSTYEDKAIYKVTVVGGNADKTEYAPGETVTITAYPAASGKQFAKWVTEGLTLTDATKATITFVMPATNVRIDAVYEDVIPSTYKVQVVGGTTDKTEYAPGETVTITAYDAASDTQFAKWVTEDGVTFTDATKSTTTFIMPAKDVRVDATYEDVISESPDAGDSTNVILWGTIAMVSALGIAFVTVMKKRKYVEM